MTDSIVRAMVDSWVWKTKPKKNYAGGGLLRVTSGDRETLVRFKSPVPRGSTVLSAELVLTQFGNTAGPVTLTVQRMDSAPHMRKVTWDTKPGRVGPTTSMTKTGPSGGTEWRIPITALVQDIADGADNRGWNIRSSSTNQIKFRSSDANGNRPRLEVRWSTRPQAPSTLSPAFGAVPVAKPVLSCDYTDNSGSTELSAIQVQIDAADNFTSGVDWDSGEVATDVPQLDLSLTSYPGLAEGASTFWRVRVKDGDNLWSQWSDSAPFSRTAKGVVAILNPPVSPATVAEFTPPILWSFTLTQVHYRVIVIDLQRPNRYAYDSGKTQSSEKAHTIPKKVLRDGRSYRVIVRAWDGVAREQTVGSPTFSSASRDFTVAYDPNVGKVATLVVDQTGDEPWVDLTFTRATAPDSFTILRNGLPIETDLESGDVVVSSGTYAYRDYTTRPEVLSTYQVLPEVNGRLATAAGSPSASVRTTAVGVFLIDPVGEDFIVLGGKGKNETAADQADVYPLLGSSRLVRSVTAVGGLSGSFSDLMLRDRNGRTWEEYEDLLNEWKGRPADTFQLVYGDQNIPVILGNIKIAPHEQTMTGRVIKSVDFDWWQIDDFPFEVDL